MQKYVVFKTGNNGLVLRKIICHFSELSVLVSDCVPAPKTKCVNAQSKISSFSNFKSTLEINI